MGGPPGLPPGGPPGDGGTPQIDLTPLLDKLESIFGRGKSHPTIVVASLTTGGIPQKIFQYPRLVKRAIIQNISTEDVTLYTFLGGASGQGIILIAAANAGEPGGSLPIGNVDLAYFWFVRTSSGVTLAVYYED